MFTKIPSHGHALGALVAPREVPPYANFPGAVDARRAKVDLDGSRPLAGMLMVVSVAALMAVADQMIETWADGHLLVVWVALWTVTFMALALLAPPLRHLTNALAARALHWVHTRSDQRADDAMWQLAQQDYRVMADIRMAGLRSEQDV